LALKSLRTSLIIDPPDGKLPPLTDEAKKRLAERDAKNKGHELDGPENRSLQERCLGIIGSGAPLGSSAYDIFESMTRLGWIAPGIPQLRLMSPAAKSIDSFARRGSLARSISSASDQLEIFRRLITQIAKSGLLLHVHAELQPTISAISPRRTTTFGCEAMAW
jgi:hypothetical protein